MMLKEKIKTTLGGLLTICALASPPLIDYLVNGSYRVTQIGEGLSRRVVHEYRDKIVIGSWAYPWGSVMIDNGKDGILDEYWFRGLSRVACNIKIEPSNWLFQTAQTEYEKLRGE